METVFFLMAYCAVLLSLLILLMKIEDIFNFTELRLAPVQNFLRREDDFRKRVGRLVSVYRAAAMVAAAGFLTCCLAAALHLISPLFTDVALALASVQFTLAAEFVVVLFSILALLLLITFLKIDSIWVYTTIETQGWSAHSSEAARLKERVEKRTNSVMNVVAVCVLLIPSSVLIFIARLTFGWN